MRTGVGGLLRAHLRAGAAPALILALAVFVLVLIALVAPLAVTAVLDRATQERLEHASPYTRDLGTTATWVPLAAPPLSGSADPADTRSANPLPPEYEASWGEWDSALERIREAAPESVRASYGPADYTVRLGGTGQFTPTTYVALDPRFAERIEVLEGRLPEASDPITSGSIGSAPAPAPAVEIVLSEPSAARESWEIGETREVGAESRWTVPVALTLVGTFAAIDPADPYWDRATGVLDPTIIFSLDGTEVVRTTGFTAPEELATLPFVAGAAVTEAWFPLQASTVTSTEAEGLLAALRGFVATGQNPESAGGRLPALSFQTGSIALLDEAVAQQRSSVAVLAMLSAGPVGAGLAVLVLGCSLLVGRRRRTLDLLVARGASGAQIRTLLGIEGLGVGVVPAALAVGVVVALAPSVAGPAVIGNPGIVVAPILLALTPALVAITLVGSRRRSRPGAIGWRGVIETLAVLVAGLATVLLIARGPGGTTDPLSIAAPVLLVLTACIAALRLAPLVLRGTLARSRRGRGFVGVLGAARALRDPTVGTAPVLALIVGVSFTIASAVLLSMIQYGGTQTARATVGSDIVLSATRFGDDAQGILESIEGVEQVVPVSVIASQRFSVGDNRVRLPLYFVDRAAFDGVQADGPGVIAPEVDLGTGEGPPRILFSATEIDRTGLDDAALRADGFDIEFAGGAAGPVPFSPTGSWALADIAYADRFADTPIPVRMLLRVASDADPDAIAAEAVDLLGPGAHATTVSSALAQFERDPVWSGLRAALLAGIVICAGLAAVAVVMTLVLGTPARRRILVLLRTLGAPPRSARAVIAWELAPAGIAAAVVGGLFGAILPLLLRAAVDLTPFTGGSSAPDYVADPILLAITVGGFLAVSGGATFLALALSRRANAATALRTVEET